MSKRLQGKTAIVTGAGRGIGRQIALALAGEGASLTVLGLKLEGLERTAKLVEEAGSKAIAISADVTDEAAVQNACKQTLDEHGSIDILVNNAAIIGPTAPVARIAVEDWEQVLKVNLTGSFLCAKAVLSHMIPKQSGKIINLSSIAGKLAYPLRASYAVSKWGLNGLTRTLAAECGRYNIQVNAICPGPVAGERMNEIIRARAAESGASVEEVAQEYRETTALKRMVKKEEVAAAVVFLASAEADSITGETLDITAGYHL